MIWGHAMGNSTYAGWTGSDRNSPITSTPIITKQKANSNFSNFLLTIGAKRLTSKPFNMSVSKEIQLVSVYVSQHGRRMRGSQKGGEGRKLLRGRLQLSSITTSKDGAGCTRILGVSLVCTARTNSLTCSKRSMLIWAFFIELPSLSTLHLYVPIPPLTECPSKYKYLESSGKVHLHLQYAAQHQ
jgi:hypothetical protein